jgi:hypothetical protein
MPKLYQIKIKGRLDPRWSEHTARSRLMLTSGKDWAYNSI